MLEILNNFVLLVVMVPRSYRAIENFKSSCRTFMLPNKLIGPMLKFFSQKLGCLQFGNEELYFSGTIVAL